MFTLSLKRYKQPFVILVALLLLGSLYLFYENKIKADVNSTPVYTGVIYSEENKPLKGKIVFHKENKTYDSVVSNSGYYTISNIDPAGEYQVSLYGSDGFMYGPKIDSFQFNPTQKTIDLGSWVKGDRYKSEALVSDTTKPTITLTGNQDTLFSGNGDVKATFKIQDNVPESAFKNIAFYYRLNTNGQWKIAALSGGQNNAYEALIKRAEFNNIDEVSYFITAEDSNKNTGYYPAPAQDGSQGTQNPAMYRFRCPTAPIVTGRLVRRVSATQLQGVYAEIAIQGLPGTRPKTNQNNGSFRVQLTKELGQKQNNVNFYYVNSNNSLIKRIQTNPDCKNVDLGNIII